MAKRNAYLSTLEKRLREQNNDEINARLSSLSDNYTKESIISIFNDFQLQLPKMGKAMTAEEKAARKAEREEKRQSEMNNKLDVIREILTDGTDEEKRQLEVIISNHANIKKRAEKEKELEVLLKQVEQLRNEIEHI